MEQTKTTVIEWHSGPTQQGTIVGSTDPAMNVYLELSEQSEDVIQAFSSCAQRILQVAGAAFHRTDLDVKERSGLETARGSCVRLVVVAGASDCMHEAPTSVITRPQIERRTWSVTG
jgi:hypothetical protein